MFLVKNSVLFEFKVLFSFDPDSFLSFHCKTKPSCEFYFVLSMFSLALI